MKIKRVPIEKCRCWEKNPRGVMRKDFERLKKQIKRLGVYKPLIAVEEDDGYLIIGGNIRLRALQELDYKEVEVSIVDATTEEKKIEYSLSDNDRIGFYQEEPLAELIYPYKEIIDIKLYKVDIDMPVEASKILEAVGPSEDEIEFVSSSCYKTISIICENDDELLEMRRLLGIEGKKLNRIKAKDLKQILGMKKCLKR